MNHELWCDTMTELGQTSLSTELSDEMDENDFLEQHINDMYDEYKEYPVYIDELSGIHESRSPNVLYQVDDLIYIHIVGELDEDTTYYVVEPTLSDEERDIMENVKQRILELSGQYEPPEDEDMFDSYFETIIDQAVSVDSDSTGIISRVSNYVSDGIELTEEKYKNIKYRLKRDISGLGPLEGLMNDTTNEDIHIIGHDECYIDNSVYGMIKTDVSWESNEDLEEWMENIGERIENPVSDATPIVDATLPDGSRVNIIYSRDISQRGPSMTIRQGIEVPLSILQITKWGTLSPKLTAYLWIALENERTVFVVGETASGKTTTLNSILTFVPRDEKVLSAEDTAEVKPPHNAWQQLITREGSGDSSNDVEMFDLVETALRSRPNYIIVGEVRGEEAQMAFQAAQTGHPVLLTFHASDIVSMIQRLTGEPINVPEPFIENCDIALFQNRVKQSGEVLRRVTSVQEIEGYSKTQNGIITRQAFSWNASDDKIEFTGQNNSYVLEEQIATLLGYSDTTKIYDELERRTKIVSRLIDADVVGYDEVNQAFDTIQKDSVQALSVISSSGVRKSDI